MDQHNRWRKPPAGGQGSQDSVAQPVTPDWSSPHSRNGSAPAGGGDPGDSDNALNPPWERDSGQWPIPPSVQRPNADEAMLGNPYIEPLIERSLPSMSMNDYSGTGKISALPVLRPGASWSRGLRAPRQAR